MRGIRTGRSPAVLFAFLLAGFGNAPAAGNSGDGGVDRTFVNVTILLDLSNRIKAPLQVEKDLKIVESVLEAFDQQVKNNNYIFSKDRIAVQVAPQPGTDTVGFKEREDLVLDIEALAQGSKRVRSELPARKKRLYAAVASIYSRAQGAPLQGADIWTFLRNQSGDLIRKPQEPGEVFKNKLIILTNGYLDFDRSIAAKRERGSYMDYGAITSLRNKPDWEKLFESRKLGLKAHKGLDFDNLEVAILEVCPKDPAVNTNEFDIISKYWTSWFQGMGVSCSVHETKQSTAMVRDLISRFLSG